MRVVNKSGLYSEFEGKEDLFVQSLQYYLEGQQERPIDGRALGLEQH